MSLHGLLATESQLGRNRDTSDVTRPLLKKEILNRGIRMTAQRQVLIDIIQYSPKHLDAASLLRIAQRKDPGINRATVYRTVALLKKLGLIDELDLMHLEGEKHFYEAKTSRDHCHIACFRCGAIMEYTSPSFENLREEIAKESGFAIRVLRLEVGGNCPKCRAS